MQRVACTCLVGQGGPQVRARALKVLEYEVPLQPSLCSARTMAAVRWQTMPTTRWCLTAAEAPGYALSCLANQAHSFQKPC